MINKLIEKIKKFFFHWEIKELHKGFLTINITTLGTNRDETYYIGEEETLENILSPLKVGSSEAYHRIQVYSEMANYYLTMKIKKLFKKAT